jgi:DNA-binding CsgD family transcriptional regulator
MQKTLLDLPTTLEFWQEPQFGIAQLGGASPGKASSYALTIRERDILALISRGLSNKSIARSLDISPETVKTHVKHIFSKLAVGTRAEAACWAGLLGLF